MGKVDGVWWLLHPTYLFGSSFSPDEHVTHQCFSNLFVGVVSLGNPLFKGNSSLKLNNDKAQLLQQNLRCETWGPASSLSSPCGNLQESGKLSLKTFEHQNSLHSVYFKSITVIYFFKICTYFLKPCRIIELKRTCHPNPIPPHPRIPEMMTINS